MAEHEAPRINDHIACAREVLDVEIAALERTRAALGPEFSACIECLVERLRYEGKVILCGIGKNLHIGHKLAATLTSTGAPAVVLHPLEALHGDLGLVGAHDTVLALSFSGETREVLNLVPALRRHGTPIVALTGQPRSTLARLSDHVLHIRIDREACPFNMAPTASTTATLALGDALALALLAARGFRKEDFARLHPGGAIGHTLLLRVEDIMRTERTERKAAWVLPGTTVREAVLAMTGARCGCVAVVDARRRVLGIFTDGDLRRHLGTLPDLIERPVEEVMTRDPITVRMNQLAADVLAVFEQHRIDDLIVIDSSGALAGMIDIQDLPKMKIL